VTAAFVEFVRHGFQDEHNELTHSAVRELTWRPFSPCTIRDGGGSVHQRGLCMLVRIAALPSSSAPGSSFRGIPHCSNRGRAKSPLVTAHLWSSIRRHSLSATDRRGTGLYCGRKRSWCRTVVSYEPCDGRVMCAICAPIS
jgi:hypothetical protein